MSEDEALTEEICHLFDAAGIASAGADARALVSAALGQGDRQKARTWAELRLQGVPLGHLLGVQQFMGVSLFTDSNVLVPREETELLGRTALEILRERTAAFGAQRLVDMCCGAGNLACALAVGVQSLKAFASDLSESCAALARRNAESLHLKDRVQVEQGDLFAALSERKLEKTIDAVVCNPPYISTSRLEKDRANLLRHEPREAFDGGPYGLSIHQRVIATAPEFLKPGGLLLFEFGAGQHRQLQILFARSGAYDPIHLINDSTGTPRVAYAAKRVS